MILVVLVTLTACGPKVKKSIDNIIKETNSYVSEINTNRQLTKISSEGALTDPSGFKDKGHYALNNYYSKSDDELYRIENIETTNEVVAENFYFKDDNLVFISTQTNRNTPMKLYIYKGKVINQSGIDLVYQNILLNKVKLLKREFKNRI